ncbi:hypothetical protein TWF751_006698 [Orbilia oligospora]|uniref:Uncharacterized protein n=1 Tax=Orbilia oligospora TaxID=2813651 RepID=A0A7C8RCP7_ORBOL|nr:hypothetical protein TWF751_006698 [Orbilia oligospora]KAF3279051.1 hypothetical protein TWF970_004161 [Orbilia oligospora]
MDFLFLVKRDVDSSANCRPPAPIPVGQQIVMQNHDRLKLVESDNPWNASCSEMQIG